MAGTAKPRRYWGGISAYQGARVPEVARRLEAEGRYGLFAGQGPMTRLAGQVADGVIGHPLWNAEWWRARALADLSAGARAAGRDAATIHRFVYLAVAPDPDEGVAFADARPFTAAYAAIAEYAGFFEERGFGAAAAEARKRWDGGDREGAAGRVGEEMARAFVAFGHPDRVRAELEDAWQVADSMLVSPPFWGLPPRRIGHWAQAIARYGLGGAS